MNIKNTYQLIGAVATALVMTSCSSDGSSTTPEDMDSTTEPAQLITELAMDDQVELLRDTKSGLTWVNDIRWCFAGVTDPTANNCAALNDATVGGVSDWRIPTSEEMSALIVAVVADEAIELNYINTSCAVMTASDGWVLTENSSSPGTISQAVPGNAGLRCVSGVQSN
ncbi:MAG: DUF1566 domain-containing protein [Granulosicoccaceae bacterium]